MQVYRVVHVCTENKAESLGLLDIVKEMFLSDLHIQSPDDVCREAAIGK